MQYNEPLGLPQGSVRAILTVVLVVAAAIMTAVNHPNAPLDAMAAMAAGHYLGYRTAKTGAPSVAPSEPLPPTDTFIPDETDMEVDKTTLIPGN